MTVFEDTELSVYDGRPVEVYKFLGTFQNYYYTSHQQEITIAGQLYTPANIKRGVVKHSSMGGDGSDLELTVPYDLDIMVDYAYEKTPPDLRVEIIRHHLGTDPATDWVKYWIGKVVSFSVTGKVGRMQVPSVFELALGGTIPNVGNHNQCNNILFDTRCGLTAASFQQNTTIVSVTDNVIEVADDGFADNYLVAGKMVIPAKSEERMITANVADVVTVNYPFYDAEAGDSIQLFAGCDHLFSTCLSKYTNTDNYVGAAFMPGYNPFSGSL